MSHKRSHVSVNSSDRSPSRQLPPLNALKAFEAVGRLGSIREAAEALSVHNTVVSRHVRNLELWLGVLLVNRGTNTIGLTAEGLRFFNRLSKVFDEIASATEEVRPAPQKRELRIWCAPAVAVQWLAPRLPQLQAIVPEAQIILRPTKESANLPKEEAHIEIKYGSREEEHVKSCELVLPRVYPVAAPAFFSGQSLPKGAAQIAQHVLIHEISRDTWKLWLSRAGHVPERVLGPCVWDSNVTLGAAAAGLGLALCNNVIGETVLEKGAVVRLPSPKIYLEPYVFRASSHLWDSPVVSKTRKWFAQELTSFGS